MMELEVNGQRYPLASGETVLGSDPDCAIVLAGEEVRPHHLVLLGLPAGAAVRSADAAAETLLNGVRVGTDPMPVLPGDQLRIGGRDARVLESPREETGRPAAGAGTVGGGRLVCVTDGREYPVGDRAIVFGRDPSADVVVTSGEVSGRHAEIRPTPEGYMLVDLSASGSFVNGRRVGATRVLLRGDVIRIGDDEFQFLAEAAPPLGPPPGAVHRLGDTLHGIPAVDLLRPEPPPTGQPIASLLVRSGALKGERLSVWTPVTTIGRAEFNDLVVPEPSVSATHARLQRREGVWMLTDLGSTNGTFVDGESVTDETPLGPGATIRLGGVSLLFEPLDNGTLAEPAAGARAAEGAVEPAAEPAPARRSGAVWLAVAVVVILAVAIAFMLLSN